MQTKNSTVALSLLSARLLRDEVTIFQSGIRLRPVTPHEHSQMSVTRHLRPGYRGPTITGVDSDKGVGMHAPFM
jgi:hypothetical protein